MVRSVDQRNKHASAGDTQSTCGYIWKQYLKERDEKNVCLFIEFDSAA